VICTFGGSVTVRAKIIKWLGYLILAALLVLSCGLGAYAAYLAMFTALIGLVVAFDAQTVLWLLRKTWLQMWILAFFLIATAFAVTAQTTKDVLYAFDFTQLLLALAVSLIFVAMSRQETPQHRAIYLLSLMSLAGTIVAFSIALYGACALRVSRPSGLEMSTIHFAYFSIILGFLSLTVLFVDAHGLRRVVLLGPILGLLSAALTGTRGSVVVLAALLLVLLVFFLRFSTLSGQKKILAIACVPFVAIGVFLISYLLGASRTFLSLIGVAQVFGGDNAADVSAALRVEHLTAGAMAFMDAPLFGHGWVNQISSAWPYMTEFGKAAFVGERWAYLHNEAMSLAVSAGVLGVFAYILIFAAPLVGLAQLPRDNQFVARAYGVLVVTTGIFAGGLTEVLFKYELPKTFLFCIVPFFMLYCQNTNSHDI
jgi:O-antigen ligase